MMTMATKHFSAVEFIQKLRKANFSEEQAEVLAKETEEIITKICDQTQIEIEKRELATKQDISKLELKIEQTKNQLILWVAGLFVASSLIQHFFK